MFYVRVAALLVLSILCGVGSIITYFTGAQTQLAAAFSAGSFGALALAMVMYAHEKAPRKAATEDRGTLGSGRPANDAAVCAFNEGAAEMLSRKRWFDWLVISAASVLGLAVLVPLRSLGQRTTTPQSFAANSWRAGLRLVTEDGVLVKASDLAVNSIVTVFPEGFTGAAHAKAMANDAVVLVRVPAEEVARSAKRASWSPQGLLAYSKLCTHAGCPVALYRAAARQLFCPCHQSTFDVLNEAKPIFGPAADALPQLPLEITADGYLAAQGGFSAPIGPSYWSRA